MPDPSLTHSASGAANTASPTATFGFTATAGRLLVFVAIGDDYFTTGPSGFTQATLIGSGESAWWGMGVWYKVAAGTESSTSYTLGSAVYSAWAVLEYSNVDSSPLDVTPTKSWASGTVASQASPSITPSAGRRLVVSAIGASSNFDSAISGVSGWTNSFVEARESATAPPSGVMNFIGIAHRVLDGGSAATTTATYEGNQAISSGGISVAFNAATSTTPTTYARRIIIG